MLSGASQASRLRESQEPRIPLAPLFKLLRLLRKPSFCAARSSTESHGMISRAPLAPVIGGRWVGYRTSNTLSCDLVLQFKVQPRWLHLYVRNSTRFYYLRGSTSSSIWWYWVSNGLSTGPFHIPHCTEPLRDHILGAALGQCCFTISSPSLTHGVDSVTSASSPCSPSSKVRCTRASG